MAGYGLTDLERGKYLPGGSNVSSTVRVQPNAFSTLPVENYVYQIEFLKTSANAIDQNVNGSVTPIDFIFNPPTTVYIQSITMSVVGQNMASIVDYFNIVGGLTNGVQMLTRIDGVTEIPFFNIKRAIEYSHATKQEFAIKNLKGNNTEEILVADVVFAFESISLPNREFIVRIRDNLSGILYQRASAMYRRVI